MKKFINDPGNVLADALAGVAAAHPELRVDPVNRVIYRAEPTRAGKVALISGGGSGHEPLHGGFVGPGMLDAACAGEVFTSPTPDQMLEATKVVDAGAGVLHIVKNYTGDVLNFEMAAELAEAEGVRVAAVVVNDDVAVEDSTWTAGRRGVGTTVLLEKIVGAAAEEGYDLDAVVALAQRVNAAGRSMGVALTSCTVPAAGKPTFDLPEDEMEVGVGIHGEPGRHRVPLASAKEIAGMLVDPIVHDYDVAGPADRDAERTRRHAAHRALPHVRRGRSPAGGGRRDDRTLSRRQLHHEPRHGRMLAHRAEGGRRAAPSVGCSRQHTRPSLGGVRGAP